jgi:hypothetical protein
MEWIMKNTHDAARKRMIQLARILSSTPSVIAAWEYPHSWGSWCRRLDPWGTIAVIALGVLSACTSIPIQRTSLLQLRVDCATTMVVGLHWDAARAAAQHLHYRLERNGIPLGSVNEPYVADQQVDPSTRYRYGITALDDRGHVMADGSIDVTTPPARVGAAAPYCFSQTIRSATWDWNHGYHAAEGSDLWPSTWGKDGNVYSFFGDGGGFGGSDVRGRASFGIARLTGLPPPRPYQETNVYGGFASLYPSTVSGKSASLVAVGSSFYAIGGLYRPAELTPGIRGPVGSMPPHVELIYSHHGAHSWRDGTWLFCEAPRGTQLDPTGPFCPLGFINFGPANSGAPGEYVYLFGSSNAAAAEAGAPGARTYLARVKGHRMLERAAYQYFAGLGAAGRPRWTRDIREMVPVFNDPNPPQPGCGRTCDMAEVLQEAVYDAGLQRFIGVAQGEHLAQTSFYEATQPWGPWRTIAYWNIDPHTGAGGFGNLGLAAGDSLGVHIINAWTSSDGRRLWMAYSSSGVAPAAARFPPPGTKMDSFNLVSADLR